MSEKVAIKVYVKTKYVGSQDETYIELDRDEYDSMTEEEVENMCRDEMFEMLEWGYRVGEGVS